MYGSGVRTGRVIIAVLLKPILLVHRVVLTALIAAAVMTTMPGTADRPIAASIRSGSVSLISACASPSLSNKSWASTLSASKLSGYELMASGQKKRRAEPPLIKTTRHQRI